MALRDGIAQFASEAAVAYLESGSKRTADDEVMKCQPDEYTTTTMSGSRHRRPTEDDLISSSLRDRFNIYIEGSLSIAHCLHGTRMLCVSLNAYE